MPRRGENIRKRKDGRWEARYIKGHDEYGKAVYGYIYRKSYAEAKLEKQRRSALVEMSIESKTKSFSALSELWLSSVKCYIKESTYAKYARICEKYLCPHIGAIQVAKFTTQHVNGLSEYLLTAGKLRGQKGLSPKTVTDILSVLKLILKFGLERHYIQNLYISFKIPKPMQQDIKILTHQEQYVLEQRLINSDDLIRLGILISLYTGLRLGELCALRWGDIDFPNGTLYVQRSISRIQNLNPKANRKTKIIIDTPKTQCSNRCIPLPVFLQQYLQKFQALQNAYVITGTQDFIEPRYYFIKYKKVLNECGLGHFNFHALRHTFATRCVENGFDIKTLAEILGHSDVKTTLNRYVHPSLEMKKSEMNKFSNFAFYGQN